jgi:prephenate dehydrogenase
MPNTISVGILGLGRIGASVALALRASNARNAGQQFAVAGFDTNSGISEAARKDKMADTFARNAGDAAAGKDIVVLALPYGETQGAYRAIADTVRSGAVVLDFAPLKLPSIEWAGKHLPAEVHMVGVTPILNPKYLFDGLNEIEYAKADLFENGGLLVAPGAKAAREAVELAADFAGLLGATPHFADPVEHDGWIAATEVLPALLGFSSFYTLDRTRAWGDIQRTGNPSFGRLTHHLHDTHPDDLRDLLLNNRENTLHHLDALIETLNGVRQTIARNDRAALETILIDSSRDYTEWIKRRMKGQWEGDDKADSQASKADGLMSGLFGTYLSKRLKRDKNGSDDE